MNNNIDYTTLSREELHNCLVYGDIPKIAALVNCNKTTIHYWFKNGTSRPDIKTAIISFLQLKDKKRDERMAHIEKQ